MRNYNHIKCEVKLLLRAISGMAVYITTIAVNSLRQSDAHMRQHNIQALLQIMAWRLFGAKPISEPMLPNCQLDARQHISMKFYVKFKKNVHSRKCTWNYRLPKSRPSCPSLNVLRHEWVIATQKTIVQKPTVLVFLDITGTPKL